MQNVQQAAERGITIWAQDEKTGISIGINRSGELFLGDDNGGYNLPDNDENRAYIEIDFRRYTGKEVNVPR